MLNVSNVVNVYLDLSPTEAARGDFGTLLIGTEESPINAFTGAHSYSDYESVLADFASTTETAKAAALYFSQIPQPSSLKIACFDVSETPDDFIARLDGLTSFYFVAFAGVTIDNTSANAAAAAVEAMSNPHILGFTDTATANLDPDDATVTLGRSLASTGYRRTICQYSANGNAVCSLLGRMASVNFNENNSTITLMFKGEPTVTAEDLNKTQADELDAHNINVFVGYKNNTSIIQYGKMTNGVFADEVHGLDWLKDAVQNNVWNTLYTSTTKIPQTDAGQNQLVSSVASALEEGVNNGLISEGNWTGNPFGQLKTGDYLPDGYYIFSPPFSSQNQSDREQRKGMPIKVAVKLAGAIHSVDVALVINR